MLHKELAVELGMPEENVIVPDNGSIIEISADGEHITKRKEKAPAGLMMVDGGAVGDTQDVVIRDRKMLAEDGMFVIIALVDQKTGKLKKSPDLISRGFVYLKRTRNCSARVRIIIKKSVEDSAPRAPGHGAPMDFDHIKATLGESISKFPLPEDGKRPARHTGSVERLASIV